MNRICRNMGNSGKSRFPSLDNESKMRLLKTHSHTSERPGYEARRNAKKVIEGNAYTVRNQTTRQNLPRIASVAGGRDEKGAMARPTTVKTRQRIVGVAGGARRRKANWSRTQARRQGKPKSNPPAGYHRGRGGEEEGENQHEMERWHNPQSR